MQIFYLGLLVFGVRTLGGLSMLILRNMLTLV